MKRGTRHHFVGRRPGRGGHRTRDPFRERGRVFIRMHATCGGNILILRRSLPYVAGLRASAEGTGLQLFEPRHFDLVLPRGSARIS